MLKRSIEKQVLVMSRQTDRSTPSLSLYVPLRVDRDFQFKESKSGPVCQELSLEATAGRMREMLLRLTFEPINDSEQILCLMIQLFGRHQ
jgi:hypothetical protein